MLVQIDLDTYEVRPVSEEMRAEEKYEGRLTAAMTHETPLSAHSRHVPCKFKDRSHPFFRLAVRWPFLARLDNTDDGLRLEDPPCRRKTTGLTDVKGCLGVAGRGGCDGRVQVGAARGTCFRVRGRGLVDVRPIADLIVFSAWLALTVAVWLLALDSPVLAVHYYQVCVNQARQNSHYF